MSSFYSPTLPGESERLYRQGEKFIAYNRQLFSELLSPGERVLDVGCAHGDLTKESFRGFGCKVTGIDKSNCIEEIEPEFGFEFYCKDVEKEPIEGEYDLIHLSLLLLHLGQLPRTKV